MLMEVSLDTEELAAARVNVVLAVCEVLLESVRMGEFCETKEEVNSVCGRGEEGGQKEGGGRSDRGKENERVRRLQ